MIEWGFRESCGAACTSAFNHLWLEHFESPDSLTLANLVYNLGISPKAAPKYFIYAGFRNPMASAVTIFGIQNAKRDVVGPGKFMANNTLTGAGGMAWGFIPDRPTGETSPAYTFVRQTIGQWLKKNK